MLARIRPHLSFANVVSVLALFIALGLGTAWAAGLANNSVKSKHIKDGQVKSADVRNNGLTGNDIKEASLGEVPLAGAAASADDADKLDGQDSSAFALNGSEAWHEVGAPGEPSFSVNLGNCAWKNQTPTNNAASFTRDRSGFVHLKGVVRAEPPDPEHLGDPCEFGENYESREIFVLPAGYTPDLNEHLAAITNGKITRVEIQAGGSIFSMAPSTGVDAHAFLSLDGLTFRCAPSGANGCP